MNGEFDPWRESGVSAELRPGGPLKGSVDVPVEVVPGGYHTSDLITMNGEVNEACREVQERVLKQLVQWVGEWPGEEKGPGGYDGGGGKMMMRKGRVFSG